ncbi:Maltose permease MAL61 [Escovopsis weberi]|uniref:Maltose permease MAL61 n=1 Tax=Escovopsis weberi TaxID=150374 RepID=A0A0M9VUA7_ESCWE|nr:Maltose permease MAL61 [Escovopsis weberi]
MARIGRRPLYLAGLLAMAAVLLATGLSTLASSSSSSSNAAAAHWAAGSLLLAYIFVYDCTVSLVSELPSTRLRTKSMVLARGAYNAVSIASNVVTPRMLNPTAWGWCARCGFFWAGSCVACAAWAFWRLPEPRGRTYGELDRLFEARVPARRFASTVLEAVDADLRPARPDKVGGTGATGERPTGEEQQEIVP